MNGRIRTLLLISVLIVACHREGSDRSTATTDSGVAPNPAQATDTSYVGGGGNITTSTGPTTTDTVGTSGGTTATTSTTAASNAKAKKAKTEPGAPGKKH